MNEEEENALVRAIGERVHSIPVAERAKVMHCMNELRRMVELERVPAMRAIVMFGVALSTAKLVDERVIIVPGGHRK